MWQEFSEILQALQFNEAPAGGALVIYHRGEQVVNTAVGQSLPDKAWDTRTLSVNFSIGKGVMATLVAVLVSRGLMDYDKPIADYWSEFGTNGKQDITLRQVLTHTAGLFNIADITDDLHILLDWQAMTDKVAKMSPSTPVGQEMHHYASAYSALVSGWILGSLVEKVTKMSLQDALDTYLAEPLGVKGELFYRLPADLADQVAKPVRYFDGTPSTRRKPTLKPDTPQMIGVLSDLSISQRWQDLLTSSGESIGTASVNRLYFDTAMMNLKNYKNALMPNGRDGIEYHHEQVLLASIPAANGVSTANALAKMYAMHAAGGVWQGHEFISESVLADLRRVQVDGFDAVMPANMRWRSGFHRLFSVQDAPNAYGHMGYNGSVAFCDPDRQLAMAFIHNFDTTMLNDVRQFALSETAVAKANDG